MNNQSSFINVFLKITSDIVVATLSPHISIATVWLLKYLKKSGVQALGCRAAWLDFCWWNWTWSPLLWCWLWGISILLNKASSSIFFLPSGGNYLQCNLTRKQQGERKGGEKVSDDFSEFLLLAYSSYVPQRCSLIRGGFPNNSRQRWEVGHWPICFDSYSSAGSSLSRIINRLFTCNPVVAGFVMIAHD